MNEIRVLQVLEATFGGTLKHMNYILDRLDASRFKMSLACSTARNPSCRESFSGLRRRGIAVTEIPMTREISPARDTRSLWMLYDHMRRERYDIVHAHSSKAGFLGRIAAWLAGVPCIIYSPHALYFYRGIKGTSAAYLFLEKLAASVTDTTIAVSRGEAAIMRDFKVCRPNKIVTIENGIDPAEFDIRVDRRAKRSELGIPEDHFVVGMVGRLCAQKGHEYFIAAAREVTRERPRVTFALVGDGGEIEAARRMAADLGVAEKIVLTGFRPDIPEIYSAFDALALPSLWEGMPYVLLEGMAMGLPVIASDIPGINEVVVDGSTGLLFPPGDVAALSERIVALLSDRERAAVLGRAGRRRVLERYGVQASMDALARLYEKCAFRGAPRGASDGGTS